jgi:hypothetical protein
MDSRRDESRHYAADDEAERDAPRRRRRPAKPRGRDRGDNRRSPETNLVSVGTLPLELFSSLKFPPRLV